jgi:PGF-pre-PGF domain-containing protein
MKKYLSILLVSVLIFGAVLPCATAGAKANSSGDNSTIEDETAVVDVSDDTNENSVQKEDTIVADDSVVIDNTVISTDDDVEYISSDDDTNITQNTNVENNTQIYDSSYEYSDKSQTNIKHVESTEVNIDNSQTVNVSFTDNSVVNNIYFESTKNSGKTKIVVEDLKDESTLTEKPPEGNVYKSFNIWIDNADVNNNIENAAVDFKVEKSWLKANGLDESSIVLNMYENGKWVEVPITITEQDSTYVYFTAEVSEYSTFAITSNTKTITVDKVLKKSNATENNSSEEETNEISKNDIIHILEMILAYLKGN